MSEVTNELMRTIGGLAKNPNFYLMVGPRHDSRRSHHRGQARLMRLLDKYDGLSVGEIAEILDVRPSSVTGLVDKLSDNGLVDRIPDERDKRITLIKLTKKGHDFLQSKKDEADDLSEEVFAGLTDEEQATLLHLLKRVSKNLSDMDFGDYISQMVNDSIGRHFRFDDGDIHINL
ncbi:MAG: MarR family transcriptional regulator [Oenococcus sp.]|uniref:MarR family winged helix-turn-helix transcriptional regulator n=1 Tax=Oenococcus sp. TaxID=1979414 RepID=UPI0039ECDE58